MPRRAQHAVCFNTLMSKPHALFIAFYFPPSRASGVYRALSTANHLVDAGWDVTVLTPPREFFSDRMKTVDASLEQAVDPRLHIERAIFPGGLESDVRRYSWLRANFPVASKQMVDRLNRIFFPDAYASWLPTIIRHGYALNRVMDFDVILATGNPWTAFGAAWWLNRLTKIPYALDYRDAWTLDMFAEQDAFPPDDAAWKWERRVMSRASLICFVNSALLEWHEARYPMAAHRMTVVHNGFDPEIFRGMGPPTQAAEAPLKFGFVGTATDKLPLVPFFQGWKAAREERVVEGAQMRMYGYLGYFTSSINNVARLIPLNCAGVSYEGPVEKAKIARTYQGLDVLVLLTASSRYVTSGKVYEYMATGKPILCVNQPGTNARDALEGYPAAVFVDSLDTSAIVRGILRVAHVALDHGAECQRDCRRFAARYSRAHSLIRLEHALREVAHG